MNSKDLIFVTGFLVHDVSRLRQKVIDNLYKPLGITRSQWWVLANLGRYSQDGIAQTELARLMNVGKVSLGVRLDLIEAQGWIERLPDPQDRRAKKVVLTESGEKLLGEMQGISMAINKKIMKGITKEQNKLLDGMLKSMKHNLIKMDAAEE